MNGAVGVLPSTAAAAVATDAVTTVEVCTIVRDDLKPRDVKKKRGI